MSNSQNMFTAERILNYLSDISNINLSDIQREMAQHEIQRVVKDRHHRPITQGRDGRWRTYIHEGRTRRQIAKVHRADLEQVLYEFYTGKAPDSKHKHTLETLYPQWLDYKRLHTRADTYMIKIESTWRNYYLDTNIVKKRITDLTVIDMDYWVHALILDHNLTKKQFYNITVIMRQMLEYAVQTGIITNSPLSAVKVNGPIMFRRDHKKSNETQVYSRDEVHLLEQISWADYNAGRYRVNMFTPLAMQFQFQTGLRLCEVCALKHSDINENTLTVRRMYRAKTREVVETTKGVFGERDVYLTEKARVVLRTVDERKRQLGIDNEFVFSTSDKPLSYSSLATIYNRYCKRLDITHRSSHKARKTYASTLIDAGVNINTVRQQLGHVDEKTTLRCYCFDRLREADRYQLIEQALQL